MINCGPNEVYSGCGDNGCQKRCNRLDVTGCIPTCRTAACICANGYVKNTAGVCVAVSDCRMLKHFN